MKTYKKFEEFLNEELNISEQDIIQRSLNEDWKINGEIITKDDNPKTKKFMDKIFDDLFDIEEEFSSKHGGQTIFDIGGYPVSATEATFEISVKDYVKKNIKALLNEFKDIIIKKYPKSELQVFPKLFRVLIRK